MKSTPGKLIVILLFMALNSYPIQVARGDSHIVINEFYANPGINENEWIELYNPGPEKILTNYQLSDASGQSCLFLDNYKIETEGFLLLQKGVDFTFSLNNDTDTVSLREGDETVDSVTYGNQKNEPSNAPVPIEGYSITRVPDGFDSGNSSTDFKVTLPSPGTKYTKQEYSRSIRINEVFPSPEAGTEEEFIEILNSSNEKVSLNYWLLDDQIDEGSAPFRLGGLEIGPGQFLVLKHSTTGLSLNNDGDTVNLIDPNNEIADSIVYSGSKQNLSYSLLNGNWFWGTPSPGEPNKEVISDQKIVLIADAKALPDESEVTTTGVVTVLPNTFSTQYFYIQDVNSGIQIYSYNREFPELALGDEITVSGQLSTASAERRLKVSQANQIIIQHGGSRPIAKRVSINHLNEDMIGLYLQVEGGVAEKRSTGFVLDQNSSQLQIVIRDGTGLKNSDFHRGDKIVLAGILSRYNSTLRLLPTGANDVKILDSGVLPLTGGGTTDFLSLSLSLYIIFILWNIFQKARKRHTKLQKNWLVLFQRELSLRCLEIWAAEKPPLLKA